MQPYPQPYPGYPQPPPPPQKSNLGLILGIVGGVILLVGIVVVALVIMAMAGTRKYISNAKQAEAKNSLNQMAKDAAQAYEGSTPKVLCPSASAPIPADKSAVSGKKYQSAHTEWQENAGFYCINFEMSTPQYYQYDFKTGPDSFSGFARGDLDGNGKFSEFEIKAQVRDGHLVIAPAILERDPEE